ncbi:MAG: hypothetical protein ABUL56_00595, partial [Actinomycetota bacterium]
MNAPLRTPGGPPVHTDVHGQLRRWGVNDLAIDHNVDNDFDNDVANARFESRFRQGGRKESHLPGISIRFDEEFRRAIVVSSYRAVAA